MCDEPAFEPGGPPEYCDTPELQAAWRRVEAFDASQAVSAKLSQLSVTLARMAEIMDSEQSAPLNWARAQLETWRERVRDTPPSTSPAEFELLDEQALSFILGEPALHAAYDVANGREMLEIVALQLAALPSRGEQGPLSPDDLRHKGVLKELRATLDEQVANGLRRLRSHD